MLFKKINGAEEKNLQAAIPQKNGLQIVLQGYAPRGTITGLEGSETKNLKVLMENE